MNFLKISSIVLAVLSILSCGSSKVIYNSTALSQENWVVEQQPEGTVEFNNNSMEITDAEGCTVWFKYQLKGAVKIEYDVIVIDAGGKYDRVSDLNCFWMANDPTSPNDFFKNSEQRQGKFTNYHALLQYYVGYGGHNNTKTRFRRYNGNENRPLLPEHDLSDKKFMIVPNKTIHIILIANTSEVKYIRNNKVVFNFQDDNPYTEGYFGIRTVNNHLKVFNLIITQL